MRVFTENQNFMLPITLISLSIAFIVVSISTFKNWHNVVAATIGEQIGFLGGIIIVPLVLVLFLFIKLNTRVDEKGIYYQFFPFHFNLKLIPWNTIDKCYIRKYIAISEFGGWGLKFGFFNKKKKSFTTKGTLGLQIILKNNSKILIGTQKKDELQRVLNTYKSKFLKD